MRRLLEWMKRCKNEGISVSSSGGRKQNWWKEESSLKKGIKEGIKKMEKPKDKKRTREEILEVRETNRNKCTERKKQVMKEEAQTIKEIKAEKELWKYIIHNGKRKETVSDKI